MLCLSVTWLKWLTRLHGCLVWLWSLLWQNVIPAVSSSQRRAGQRKCSQSGKWVQIEALWLRWFWFSEGPFCVDNTWKGCGTTLWKGYWDLAQFLCLLAAGCFQDIYSRSSLLSVMRPVIMDYLTYGLCLSSDFTREAGAKIHQNTRQTLRNILLLHLWYTPMCCLV